MGLVYYISREPNKIASNITQIGKQLAVEKFDFVKLNAKHFLLNISNYESNASQIEADYQSLTNKNKNLGERN